MHILIINTQAAEPLREIMYHASKFEGKLPETGEEWFDYYSMLGRKLFDVIDADQDGDWQTDRQIDRQTDRQTGQPIDTLTEDRQKQRQRECEGEKSCFRLALQCLWEHCCESMIPHMKGVCVTVRARCVCVCVCMYVWNESDHHIRVCLQPLSPLTYTHKYRIYREERARGGRSEGFDGIFFYGYSWVSSWWDPDLQQDQKRSFGINTFRGGGLLRIRWQVCLYEFMEIYLCVQVCVFSCVCMHVHAHTYIAEFHLYSKSVCRECVLRTANGAYICICKYMGGVLWHTPVSQTQTHKLAPLFPTHTGTTTTSWVMMRRLQVFLSASSSMKKLKSFQTWHPSRCVSTCVCVCVGGDTELKTLGDGNLSDMATVSACACLCVCMYVCIWMPAQGA